MDLQAFASWAQIISAAGAAVATFIALLAVKQARRAADETRGAATSAILAALISEYHSLDMHKALRSLGDLRKSYPQIPSHRTAEMDVARRRVHWFYKKVWLLHKAGSLDKGQVSTLIHNTHGFELWAEYVLPWSKAVDPSPGALDWHRWAEDFMREFRPKLE